MTLNHSKDHFSLQWTRELSILALIGGEQTYRKSVFRNVFFSSHPMLAIWRVAIDARDILLHSQAVQVVWRKCTSDAFTRVVERAVTWTFDFLFGIEGTIRLPTEVDRAGLM